jgi:hypothetical protein
VISIFSLIQPSNEFLRVDPTHLRYRQIIAYKMARVVSY